MNTNLFEAVKAQLGEVDDLAQTLADINSGGADTEWPGFTYYTDTCKFYDENHEEIWEALSEDADMQGCTPMELIASFMQCRYVKQRRGAMN